GTLTGQVMYHHYYRLTEDFQIEPTDADGWAETFDDPRRFLARDRVGAFEVSTVFLGINHAFTEGPPLVFETMIFLHGRNGWEGGEQYMERFATYDDAMTKHAYIVQTLRQYSGHIVNMGQLRGVLEPETDSGQF